MSDFGMRHYSATLGRWLNRDPIGDLGGANVYAYVGNNPTNRTDYLGMMYIPCPYLHTDPSRCGPQGGSTPPESGGQEENDKKPCPGKRDLYQQSQPTTPTPDLPERWQPPKPYGTCKDCASECNKDDVKQANAFGVYRTENGAKCYCICTNMIYEGVEWRRHRGLKLANQIIENCAAGHEQTHLATGASENQPDMNATSCISDGFDTCTSSGLDQSQLCRCLNRLKYTLDTYAQCDSNGTDQAKCKEARAAAQKKYYDLKKQHKCR